MPGAAALVEVIRERDGDEDVHERSGTEATADRDLHQAQDISCEHIILFRAARWVTYEGRLRITEGEPVVVFVTQDRRACGSSSAKERVA